MPTDQELYDQLSFYTLSHGDPAFLHQHIVDAFAAQHSDEQTKPIRTVFALIGLYLYLEKGFTGRQVQQMHTKLARQRKQWPTILPPAATATLTVADVLAAAPGSQRDKTIRDWCIAVWEKWQPQRHQIVELARKELNIQ
ncbi:DUF5946 family protein [Acidicapsa acidisoli]|uniref:DUF5946 family protein n=1 Tax=Acidicapsa acidisoli TaxID=1615681 RepID=UPI0021DFD7EB|nr:DUF5946 family protein [Acidicapsa acidisoli]